MGEGGALEQEERAHVHACQYYYFEASYVHVHACQYYYFEVVIN